MHVHTHHRRLYIPEGVRASIIQTAAALPTLIPRSDDSDEDENDRCSGKDSGVCERPTDSTKTTTIPVVLGVVIPLGVAIIVMLILHRRHVKKLAQEDASDKYKSYDFGLDEVVVPGDRKKSGRGMVQKEKPPGHQHGISLDLNIDTYLPPPSVLGPPGTTSTLSLSPTNDSTSRTGTSKLGEIDNPFERGHNPFDDKYAESSAASQRSPSPGPMSGLQQPPNAYIPGAIRADAPNTMQRTNSGRALTPTTYNQNIPEIIEPDNAPSSSADMELPKNLQTAIDSHDSMNVPRITLPDGAEDDVSDYDRNSTQTIAKANAEARAEEAKNNTTLDKELGFGDFGLDSSSKRNTNNRMSFVLPPEGYQLDQKRLTSAGIRPLPPHDPTESPDQRASRIRSFYKEYFDPNKDANHTKSMYFGDLEDAPVDSVYGAENIPPMPTHAPDAPFAEPPPRRAMTPPPRMPSEAFAPPRPFGDGWGSRPSSRGSNMESPSIRVQSSVSNRFGPTPPPPRQQKRRPPPEPLQMIPTPHAMKDD
ncbi:hypothetical protein KEM56_006119, partial [Ascosphaera pollenicola]